MDSNFDLYLSIAFSTAFLYLLAQQYLKKIYKIPLPPGPPADPFIGHLHFIPSEKQPELFHEWAKVHGDVMHLKCLGYNIIVLDSIEAAHNLLERRSAIYSCRPRAMVLELMGFSCSLPLLQYGEQFIKHRKVFQFYFGSQESLAFVPIQVHQAQLLAQNLVLTPHKHEDHLERFAAVITTQITMAHQIIGDHDPTLKVAKDISYAFNNCGPPGNMTPIDFFPWLRYLPSWFPGTFYAYRACSFQKVVQKMYDYPVEIVKKQLADGTAQSSFIVDHLQALSPVTDSNATGTDDKMDLNDIKGAVATIYVAATDTSHTALSVFLLAMVLHPNIQKKAQEEIDAVIGKDRLPEYVDRGSLPYIECVLQEVFRWHPVSPFGVPHHLIKDDIYKGMFIPKGSVVIANTRGMSLNEKIYTDPTQFNPSRFLPKPQGLGEPYFTGLWGFGRRICPGRFLAENGLWIGIATILATMNIVKAKDENGVDIVPACKFTSGIVSGPTPFKLDVVSRGHHYEKLLEESTL